MLRFMKQKAIRVWALALVLALTLGCFSFTLPGMRVSAEEDVNIRIGVISDVHITGRNADGKTQTQHFTEALEWYRDKGVDAIMIAGDLTQGYCPIDENVKQLKEFFKAWFSVFPDNKNPKTGETVEPVMVYGNHDADLVRTESKGNYWEKNLGEKYQPVYTKEVKGYQFVGAHWGSEGKIGDALEDAVSKSDGKPVFYIQHPHPTNTCYGSQWWGDSSSSAKHLKKYENVIAFSGHSHFPLTDERSIWQGDYTSIGTASLHYVELESGKLGGTIPKDNTYMKQGMYITVTDSKVDIERHNFFYDETIGKNWVLQLPLDKETFAYTEDRVNSSVAPTFGSDDKVTADHASTSSVSISFPAATLNTENDIVHSYMIETVDKATGETVSKDYIFSEFYLGKNQLSDSYTATIAGLQPDTTYEFKVYALNSLQKMSETFITGEAATRSGSWYPDVLDVNFLEGTAKDDGVYQTKLDLMGDAKVELDETIGKYVLSMDGDGDYLNCWLNADQYGSMAKEMTMEVLFKADDLSANRAIMECTQGAGMGFEVTGDGSVVDLWLYLDTDYHSTSSGNRLSAKVNDNKYYHLMATLKKGKLSLYLDGALVGSDNVGTKKIQFNNSVAFALGADAEGDGTGRLFFDGSIALARLYSHGVDEKGAKALYENAMSTLYPVTVYQVSNGVLNFYSDKKCTQAVELSSVKEGDTVYLQATPNEGMYVTSLTVNGEEFENGGKLVVDGKKIVRVKFDTIPAEDNKVETENTEKVKDVTAENVTLANKTDLENAKADYEKALNDNGDKFSDDEKKTIKEEIARIEEALKVIENVEAVADQIGDLPENITKDDIDDVDAAKKAYDELSAYEKSLIDSNTKKKLDSAVEAAEEANKSEEESSKPEEESSKPEEESSKPEDTDSPDTGDHSNLLWIAFLLVSGAGIFGVILNERKRKTANK